MNSKRSFFKHTLLSTATNLHLICFGTILPRPYIRPTFLSLFFFLSVFLFFSLSLSLLLLLSFLQFFFFFYYFWQSNSYHRNNFFCLIVRWIINAACLGIVAEICFQCLANLSKLTDFYSAWNHHEILIFWWFFREILVSWIAQFCLAAEENFGNNSFNYFCI